MELDMEGWIHRAAAFTETLPRRIRTGTVEVDGPSVEPPLSDAECRHLEASLTRGLPTVMNDLLTRGSRSCDCRYVYAPAADTLPKMEEVFPYNEWIYGGARFCSAEQIPYHVFNCGDWAEAFAEFPEDQRMWATAFPLAHIGNGDYLGLDTAEGDDDPPVIYLAHDDQSRILSPSLSVFLSAWERLCYIGPEIWLLEEFLGDDGMLTAVGAKADALRALLGAPQ